MEPGEEGGGGRDMVTDQVGQKSGDMVTDQALGSLTGNQQTILDAADVPRSLADLLELAGVSHRTFFRRKHLQPLLDAGLVQMTNPENPQASDQKYVLTGAGVELKASRTGQNEENGDGEA